MMTPVEQYERLPPELQRLLDEINFLASELRDHLVLEQFYLALTALNVRLQQLHPEIPCVQACSACCQAQGSQWSLLPVEWDLMQQALDALPQTQQARILTQLQSESRSCPLLLDGRCSVYAFRPLDCRLKGYSFSQEQILPMHSQLPQPFSCQPEQERMRQDLSRSGRQIYYMFFPQRERLQRVLQSIEPAGEAEPRQLSAYLHSYFQARDSVL